MSSYNPEEHPLIRYAKSVNYKLEEQNNTISLLLTRVKKLERQVSRLQGKLSSAGKLEEEQNDTIS